jgi:hypothetical protein
LKWLAFRAGNPFACGQQRTSWPDRFGTAAIFKEHTVATQQPEDSETGKGGAPVATPAELSASGLSRRGFAKLGAGAGGVLLTLASQPGMAQTVCASPSQSLSKWKSTHAGQQLQCSGVSPGYWVQTFHSWPSPLETNRATLTFGAMFDCGGRTDYRDILVQDLLSPQKFDTDNIGRHFAATYLNIQANKISFLTLDGIRNIWYEWLTTGFYRPTAGVKWDGTQIVSYLQSTMG